MKYYKSREKWVSASDEPDRWLNECFLPRLKQKRINTIIWNDKCLISIAKDFNKLMKEKGGMNEFFKEL